MNCQIPRKVANLRCASDGQEFFGCVTGSPVIQTRQSPLLITLPQFVAQQIMAAQGMNRPDIVQRGHARKQFQIRSRPALAGCDSR